jgi:peptidoglycan/xylan/chitin deacetylase (PgdA/CDA1 family)
MPWKQGYTISDEKSLADADLRWPDGRRCCLAITVDLGLARSGAGIGAADLTDDRARFGLAEGLPLLRGLLARLGLRATFAVPAVIAEVLGGAALRGIAAEGHEIAAHGLCQEDVSGLAREEERARIARATDILAGHLGAPPAGWFSLPRQADPFAGGTISPHTMDLLLAAGYAYFGNGLADDIPHYWVTDFATRRAMLTLPYYYHYDDQFFLLFPDKGTGLEHADALARNWRAEFAAQYRRGRYFHMTLHPHAIGFGHRLRMLEDVLTEIARQPGLWNATGTEIALHWRETWPAETSLQLKPSIWQDHPGSLS